LHLLGIISVDGEGLSLSVERVDHVLVRIMETLIWEVLRGALHLLGEEVSLNRTLGVVIDEMIMG